MNTDVRSLFDAETIGILLTLVSVALTRVFKVQFDTDGNTTRLINAGINFVKGAIVMFMAGEASLLYVVGWSVIGFLVDQAAYFALVKPEKKLP
jgi:hypothetical protein